MRSPAPRLLVTALLSLAAATACAQEAIPPGSDRPVEIILPYAVSDTFANFATVEIEALMRSLGASP